MVFSSVINYYQLNQGNRYFLTAFKHYQRNGSFLTAVKYCKEMGVYGCNQILLRNRFFFNVTTIKQCQNYKFLCRIKIKYCEGQGSCMTLKFKSSVLYRFILKYCRDQFRRVSIIYLKVLLEY